MQKLDLKELSPKTKFLLMASMKIALTLEAEGWGKEKYMIWCSEIWESMKMSDPDSLQEVLNDAMEDDIDKYLQIYKDKKNS